MTPQDLPRTDTPAKESLATVARPVNVSDGGGGMDWRLVWTQPVEVVDFYAEVE